MHLSGQTSLVLRCVFQSAATFNSARELSHGFTTKVVWRVLASGGNDNDTVQKVSMSGRRGEKEGQTRTS